MSSYFLTPFFPAPSEVGAIVPALGSVVYAGVPLLSGCANMMISPIGVVTVSPVLSVTSGAVVAPPTSGAVATFPLPDAFSGAVLVIPLAAVISELPVPDAHTAATVLASTALSQALVVFPAVAGSGNVITSALEAGGIFATPTHIGGLTALLYELALNDIGVYALVVVDGITYVLPLNPEVVINLAQRN